MKRKAYQMRDDLMEAVVTRDLRRVRELCADAGFVADSSTTHLPLCTAAAVGDADMVAALLDSGRVPVDGADQARRRTALYYSVMHNKLDAMRALLMRGADSSAPSNDLDATPLVLAMRTYNHDAVALILTTGATHGGGRAGEDWSEDASLHVAALRGDADAVSGAGPLVNARCKDGYTPLHLACHFGQAATVAALLAAGADASLLSNRRYTAAHIAAMRPEPDTLACLLTAKPPLHGADHQGHTALALAVYCDRAENARLLLAAGADADVPDGLFGPLITYSASNENREMVRVLLEGGADADAQDGWGCTALTRAMEAEDMEMAELLVGAGADVADTRARSALDVVVAMGAHWAPDTRRRVALLLRGAVEAQRAQLAVIKRAAAVQAAEVGRGVAEAGLQLGQVKHHEAQEHWVAAVRGLCGEGDHAWVKAERAREGLLDALCVLSAAAARLHAWDRLAKEGAAENAAYAAAADEKALRTLLVLRTLT